MILHYDFHIHSALSPCSDIDMTPNNIVNMAKLKGLDVIAITDHNSIDNVAPAMKAGMREGIIVIPGMEVQTIEEVHILCLFPTIEAARQIAEIVYENLPDISNRPDIFGEQLIFNEADEIIGKEEKLLINSTNLSTYRLYQQMREAGGAYIPCHIDRPSYSIVSNLGFIPEDLPVRTVELSCNSSEQIKQAYRQYRILINSDAHELGDISEPIHSIEIFDNFNKDISKKLCNLL